MQRLAAEKEESCARTGSKLEEILGSLAVLDTELASVKQSAKELEESLSTNESTARKRIDALDKEVSELKNENHRLCELCKERNVILQSQAAEKEESLVSADARLEAPESRSQQLEESSTMRQADLDAAPERIDVVDTAVSEH